MDLFGIKKRGRKKIHRNVDFVPVANNYTPDKTSTEGEGFIYLLQDEIEALRLKNLNNLSIREGAVKMGISKSLFAKIYNSGVYKLTEALIYGKEIVISK
ncbi:MAG: DUF134 domain-containing protein [Candidatus Absconditabacteria bacterium]